MREIKKLVENSDFAADKQQKDHPEAQTGLVIGYDLAM
jgi:hypothetical protein